MDTKWWLYTVSHDAMLLPGLPLHEDCNNSSDKAWYECYSINVKQVANLPVKKKEKSSNLICLFMPRRYAMNMMCPFHCSSLSE